MTSEMSGEKQGTEETKNEGTKEDVKEEKTIEYDDFGLPVRKRRPRTPVEDSEEEEHFEDAVAGERKEGDVDEPAEQISEEGEEVVSSDQNEAVKRRNEVTQANEEVVEVPQTNGEVKGSGTQEPTKEQLAPPEELRQDMPSTSESTTTIRKSEETPQTHRHQQSVGSVSEYSHQAGLSQPQQLEKAGDDDGGWQTMPAYAHYDMYDDDNRLVAKENAEELQDMSGYGNVGGAAKGYTRVTMDDDAESQTSMDDNTAYLFKETTTALHDEDEAVRDPLTQRQTTKKLLTEGQRVAYVGLVRLAMVAMEQKSAGIEKNKRIKKTLDLQTEQTKMWSQKVMLKLYGHMDIDASEQIMIEQLSEHGVVPADLTPALMQNARVRNPAAEDGEGENTKTSTTSPQPGVQNENLKSPSSLSVRSPTSSSPPPPYEENEDFDSEVRTPSQLPDSKNLDIDLRWTVMCDLFLALIADGIYDSRSRELFEQVGKYLSIDWLEICRFEKRVTEALEMQEQADKENWNEDDHMKSRAKSARNRRLAFMGLATVGGGLVIGLSAGLLAPLIGAGLAAGFTTIGVAGTSSFLAGAGGAAIITSTGIVTGSTVGVRAANRRTGAVKTFEYRPLHNNKRTHLIITLAGWMNGKVDDVRLPFSTVDPIMGDIYSVLWEPDMLRSMGDTINILATEALTQGLQQVLGSTILTALMAAMTLPLALTKLSYLIDNPWSVSQARADMAGLILADSLIDRNLGTRPVTLVGFSLGARVIFSCLKELANRGAFGLIQNVYMFGTPVVAKNDEYTKARSVVPGRFVNGYATNDWILGYLFRATSGGIMRVAGLSPVNVATIENVNVTELVPGHMAYRAAMPRLLREVGWEVESDEFTEIEDPDPENHEKRQRELINEIEEARKELEKKAVEKEKKGGKLSWWRKKKADKKDWEVYDDLSQQQHHKPIDKDADPAQIAENPIMFDIDAIRREVASLAAESKEYNAASEFEIKEIKSTLPPMKIDITTAPSAPPYSMLRETKSYNDSLGSTLDDGVKSAGHLPSTNGTHALGTATDAAGATTNGRKVSFEEYDGFDAPEPGPVQMTFDTSFSDPATHTQSARNSTSDTPSFPANASSHSPLVPFATFNQDLSDPSLPIPLPAQPPASSSTLTPPTDRPPLLSSKTAPHPTGLGLEPLPHPGYNAWADEFEDEFGKEEEVKMSFM